jgi:Zn-dependent protease with chaperone function
VNEALRAWHYDGLTAVRHELTVEHDSQGLILSSGERVPFSDLVPIGYRGAPVFRHREREGWRLGFEDELPSALAADLPRQEHHGGIIDRIGIVPALIGGAILAAAILYGLATGTTLLAHLIPERWEMAFGESLTGDFGGRICTGAEGQQALDRLATRLSTDGRPVRIRVIDLRIVNAAALPGRQIVVLDGLIDKAESPDEVAGVLGHEIGHVERRHVMAALLRDFGLSLLLGGADGGAIAQGLLASRYSRGAEREADESAIEGMARAKVSPMPTAAFFARLGKDEAKLGRTATMLNYVSSHPLSEERRNRFAASFDKAAGYRPALSTAEWKAVRAMCGTRKQR